MPARRRPLAFATILAVLFLTFLDTTIVTVVLGDIQYELGAGVTSLQWVVNGYALPFAALMLFAGAIGDRWGRKRMMLIGLAIFLGGSLLAALAPTVGMLIAGRAVMGVGAAACEPGTLSLIRQLYPQRAARAKAVGAWAAVAGASLAVGPVLGGLLAALRDWRDVFWFNVIAGALLLILAAGCIGESRDDQSGRLDLAGAGLGAVGLGGIVFAAMFGQQGSFSDPLVIALFAVGGICAAAFVLRERRSAAPIVDVRALAARPVAISLFGAFAVYFGVFSIFFFTALYLDLAEGYDGFDFAALFGGMAATIMAGGLASGWWVARSGPRRPLLVGSVVAAVGLVWARFALTDAPTFGVLAAALALCGLGVGIAVVPVTTAVLTQIPGRRSGMAAGATNTARQLGAVAGVTVLGGLVSHIMAGALDVSLSDNPLLGRAKDAIMTTFRTGGDAAKELSFVDPNPAIAPVVNATAAAFRDGIHAALLASAVLIGLVAVTALLMPGRAADAAPEPTSEIDRPASA